MAFCFMAVRKSMKFGYGTERVQKFLENRFAWPRIMYLFF